MVINIILIVMATATLFLGGSFCLSEKNKSFTTKIMTINIGTIFAWELGYALMGFSTYEPACIFWRAVGLFGVLSTIIYEFVYVKAITGTLKKTGKYISAVLIAIGIIDWFLLIQPSTIDFVRLEGRTAYYSYKNFGRSLEGILIGILFIIMFSIALIWLHSVKRKRDKRVVLIMIVSHFVLILSCIPDTLLPILGLPSFPGSCFGAFICYLINIFVAERLNAFDISEHNMNQYIYGNVSTGVLIIDADYKPAMANKYALDFFGISNIKTTKISELFQISEEDAVSELQKANSTTEINLISQNNNIACSLVITPVYDSFHEPMCYVCFIYDRTKEIELYNEVSEMKTQLQHDLMDKTYEMERFILQAVTTIANTIDAKDPYTKGHSIRVAEYSAMIAEAIGYTEDEIQRVRYSALLHDIGKIGVSELILNKPGRLTPEEYDQLKEHTTIGGQILKDIKILPDLDVGAKYHHERYDGKGYPQGLAGESIPKIARIIGIADAYDAMNSKRIYRDNLTKEKIESELINGRGTQFDPYLLDQFIALLKQGLVVSQYDSNHSMESITVGSNKILDDIEDDIRCENEKTLQYDALTGLPNKTAAVSSIGISMMQETGAFGYLDLDNLSSANELFGEQSGDEVIRTVADILSQSAKGTVARVGGDEFVFFFPGLNNVQAHAVLKSILFSFRRKKATLPQIEKCSISVSMGVYLTASGDTYETAFVNADKALYHMKKSGKDGYFIYE